MVAYDIDTAAAMDAVRKTEGELTVLSAVPGELHRSIDAVQAALGSSRVARAFAALGTGELLPELRSVLRRAEESVRGATLAVTEYRRADQEMRVRAEAAAAAVPPASGKPAGSAPAAALPGVLPVPLPRPVPQQTEPDQPGKAGPLLGPPSRTPEWLFRPAHPGRAPIVVARDLMLRLHHPCPGGWLPDGFRPSWSGPAYPPGRWLPRWPGPAYPPGGWFPRWPGPAYPPGAWFPRWPGPAYPPGGWFPRWPEPGLPPQGRYPWWPARPLPALPDPRLTPAPGGVLPLETKQVPLDAGASSGPQRLSGANSGGTWGLT